MKIFFQIITLMFKRRYDNKEFLIIHFIISLYRYHFFEMKDYRILLLIILLKLNQNTY